MIAPWAAQQPASHGHVCVIPAFDESVALLDGLAAAVRGSDSPVLFIVVVNATDGASPAVHERNAALCDALRAGARDVAVIAQEPPIHRLTHRLIGVAGLEVLLVDRGCPGYRLPSGQGVGLARRIGCDIALTLGRAGVVTGRWIHTTDADVTLPAGYFPASLRAPAASVGLTYPFWHDAREHPALGLYEISLRYYVLGLRWAGSPYAHHTVGSTLAVDAGAYAACRGVPRRLAGEDFYLLNKLAKLGAIHRPPVEAIGIRARESQRVPFGTGPATRRIAEDLAHSRPFRLYHPRSFAALARWLEVIDDFVLSPSQDPRDLLAAGRAGDLSDEEVGILDRCLSAMGAFAALTDAHGRTRRPEALKKRLVDWFDGFRTLKLIHRLRDAGHGDVPWRDALRGAPFARGIDPDAEIGEIRRALFTLEQ